eukprot:402499_1
MPGSPLSAKAAPFFPRSLRPFFPPGWTPPQTVVTKILNEEAAKTFATPDPKPTEQLEVPEAKSTSPCPSPALAPVSPMRLVPLLNVVHRCVSL